MRADEEAAYQAFFARHHTDLARLAYLITGDPNAAADIAADALVEIWRHWRRVRSTGNPLGYARGVLANTARGWLRRERRERLGLLRSRLSTDEYRGPDVPAVLDVRAALRRLPIRRRECVVLRYAFDVPEKEVAAILGISVGAVKSHTSRGADQLATLLRKAGTVDDLGLLPVLERR
ncbi:SigE family RNA polymerase sigma factor [Actinoplanes sp. NBRC 103695]|uniref:SigE family RNA polymerase sigma factor n=1 Tax=Actinoplanes sp. NBRC 103695 TaxID=3032202 RepID=UPI0024A35069|nr:SigE family RNA polymerase sigma factor [Actinoplanes sp. NBRC 103695]GLY99935.1 RNA polymerase sigma factor [Actinoplanes sp. NBRC 103695]